MVWPRLQDTGPDMHRIFIEKGGDQMTIKKVTKKMAVTCKCKSSC